MHTLQRAKEEPASEKTTIRLHCTWKGSFYSGLKTRMIVSVSLTLTRAYHSPESNHQRKSHIRAQTLHQQVHGDFHKYVRYTRQKIISLKGQEGLRQRSTNYVMVRATENWWSVILRSRSRPAIRAFPMFLRKQSILSQV